MQNSCEHLVIAFQRLIYRFALARAVCSVQFLKQFIVNGKSEWYKIIALQSQSTNIEISVYNCPFPSSLGVQNYPCKGKKTKQREETSAVVVIECEGKMLLLQRPKGGKEHRTVIFTSCKATLGT